MAGRAQNKSKGGRSSSSANGTQAASSSGAKQSPKSAISSSGQESNGLESRVKKAESERDQVALELAAAQLEIAALKAKHMQAVNQIDWVLDSLHNIVDDKI